ncbi:FOXD [Lepeophtheirus salmonis]|uniref:FOXD n=1 Tax=Lepeophtheirus salmonis TaxID=72036 RepID=C1BTJ7_LEPSM|nr:forkhead box protein G1-like [Lepeophtheirus salmonis]ACO12350.1 Forkhead box protein K2 [Lepeophtheirus salmonis]CAB4054075.1 FOXD [Lepeophtheirus salmonis]CAF2751718.1 FOXD [Lepeophtheirus salmonis]
MDSHFKIELTCDVPDIMNEEIVIQENGSEFEERYEFDPESTAPVQEVQEEPICYYEEAYITDNDSLSYGDNLVIDSGTSHDTDLQTAIDLAKFSEQGKDASNPRANSSPQRYIILQYPEKSKITKSNDFLTSSSSSSSTSGGGIKSTNTFGKPKLSYAAMITEVIRCAPNKRLTLNEIYQAISARYPYYKMDCKNWQNSIRHNLSLNHSFVKVPRPENKGRGHFWTIDYSKEKNLSKTVTPSKIQHIISDNISAKYRIFNVAAPPV